MNYFKAVKYRRWMNALIILNEGDASVFIKDNEYFYNPIEWVIFLNQGNKALNPLLEDPDTTKPTTTITIENIPPKSQKASNLNDANDNLDVLSTNNDFQRDFQLTRSHTNLTTTTISSTVSSVKSQEINYKTWYGVPNPYHESNTHTQSKCEHIPYKNYSTDHQNSTFTPAIFTPRKSKRLNPPKIQQKQPDDSQQFIDLAYYDEDKDVRTILKLMDKFQEKMTQTHSYSASINFANSPVKSVGRASARTQNTQNSQNSQKPTTPLTPNRITDRGPVFITSAKSVPSSPFLPAKISQSGNEKRILHQFILKQQEGLFLPDISNSVKLSPSSRSQSKSAVKDQLHNIYEFYSDHETLIGFVPNTSASTNFYINKANEQNFSNQNNNTNNQNNQYNNIGSSMLDAITNNNDNNSKQIDPLGENLLNRKPKKSIIALSADSPANANKTKEVKFSLKK
jgi:hypothetical protein